VTAAGGTKLTETGLAVGTPDYMSPEQAAGNADVDNRSDLYSLGCVLYEMLSGEAPYTGRTPEAILAKKLTEPVPHVSVLRDTVPAAVEAALTKMLARVPADRFATAQQLVEALAAPFAPAHHVVARSRPFWTRPAVVGVLVVVLAAAVWLVWRVVRGAGTARVESLAVLPPQDLSGDSTQAYFVLGVYDGLIGELDQIGALRVISRTSSMPYKGTTKSVPQIARELNVEGIIESSVLKQGDSVHVRVQLVRARPVEQSLWSRKYDRDIAGVLKLYADVAQDIARETRAGLTSEQMGHLAKTRQVNPQTYEAYVKGMYYLDKGTPEGTARGLALLRDAIDHDPGDALAWSGLAVGYITAAHGPTDVVDALPAARAAAERALMLDSTLTQTMAALAFLKGYYDWEWDAADQMFRRTIELNPSSAMAHYWYAWQLDLFDHMDSAIAEHKRAREVDPLNPLHTAWLGGLYYEEGRYDEALAEARRSLELDPAFPIGYYVMASAYTAKGMHAEAVAAARRAVEADSDLTWFLGRTYAMAGRRAEAQRILTELQAEKVTPWVAYGLAVVNAALGNKDEAFRWLNYEHPFAWVPWVRVSPFFKSLRSDPRFSELLREMHLPPAGPLHPPHNTGP
jgi:TolB-like protein/Flp pilus assembly protein TadD